MQVGDPFLGKLLLEACLELFAADVLQGIQDMGAAGLTSSSVEMAARAGNGLELSLDDVPRRARHMTPYEILLSESQERMLLVAQPGKEDAVLAICRKWDLDCAVIGRVTASKRWVVTATPGFDPLDPDPSTTCPVVVCDLPIHALTDDAPVYDRPQASADPEPGPAVDLPVPGDLEAELYALLASPNVGSKRWIWRQYDHIVRGGTVVIPGADAAVVRVLCERDAAGSLTAKTSMTEKLLAFAVDCNGRFVEADPFVGAAMAVAETCRNLVCSGAEPIGMTDCLNFGNPERPEVMRQLARAIDGIAAACTKLAVPIVSGNVSLYNETDGRAIIPTPTVAAVGLLRAMEDIVTPWWKEAGHGVFLLGPKASDLPARAGLVGSEYAARKRPRTKEGAPWLRDCPGPAIDLDQEQRLQALVLGLARERKLASAHDVSDGGLAVALAECAALAPDAVTPVGARIDLELAHEAPAASLEVASLLFGEHPTRIVVSVRPGDTAHVLEAAERANVAMTELGVTGGSSLSLTVRRPRATPGEALTIASFVTPIKALQDARDEALRGIVGD